MGVFNISKFFPLSLLGVQMGSRLWYYWIDFLRIWRVLFCFFDGKCIFRDIWPSRDFFRTWYFIKQHNFMISFFIWMILSRKFLNFLLGSIWTPSSLNAKWNYYFQVNAQIQNLQKLHFLLFHFFNYWGKELTVFFILIDMFEFIKLSFFVNSSGIWIWEFAF